MTPPEYLAHIKAALVTSDLVASFEVVEEWAQPDRGYIRVRMWLANGGLKLQSTLWSRVGRVSPSAIAIS